MKRLERALCDALKRHLAGAAPRVPEGGALLWEAFATLSAARGFGELGPQPVTLAEVEALARLWLLPFERRHVSVILALDRVWLAEARAAVTGQRRPIGGPMSPALFDAIFG